MICQFFPPVLCVRNVSSKTFLQEEVETKGKQSYEQQKIKGGNAVIEVQDLCVLCLWRTGLHVFIHSSTQFNVPLLF